jgi:hypothetical protein
MLILRPRHALVSDNEGDSSSSSLELYSDSNSNKDKEYYYLYNKSSNDTFDSNAKSLALPSPTSTQAQNMPTLLLKEHLIAARSQAVTLKYLAYPVYQIKKLTSISRSQIFYLYAKALERGWKPDDQIRLED